jgi:hypothetical protein
MAFDLRNEGYACVSVTWWATGLADVARHARMPFNELYESGVQTRVDAMTPAGQGTRQILLATIQLKKRGLCIHIDDLAVMIFWSLAPGKKDLWNGIYGWAWRTLCSPSIGCFTSRNEGSKCVG